MHRRTRSVRREDSAKPNPKLCLDRRSLRKAKSLEVCAQASARSHFVSHRSSRKEGGSTGRGMALSFSIFAVPIFKMAVPFSGFGGNNATRHRAFMI